MDGEWTTDHTAPQENDGANNINNVLNLEDIENTTAPVDKMSSNMISGVTPQSTTADLAGKVPLESEKSRTATQGSSDLPGSFPETPAKEPSEFGVNPIPATSGIGNPVNLAPGEKVPDSSTFTSNTISSTAKDDPSLMPISQTSNSAPQLPEVVTPENQRGDDAGMFNLPPISKNMIPESSLPMGDTGMSKGNVDAGPTIQSAGAGTSTAALAAQVPREPRRDAEVIDDSKQMAKHIDKPGVQSGGLPASIQDSINSMNAASKTPIAPTVPDVVQESITESATSPEATGNTTAVQEKSEMEDELLRKVKPEDSLGEPAPTASATTTDTAPNAGSTLDERSSKVPNSAAAAPSSTTAPSATTKDASEPLAESVTPAATSAAVPAKTPATEEAASAVVDSRDISPMTRPETMNQTQPMVTSGLGSSAAPASSGSAPTSTGRSNPTPAPSTDKKSKRASGFFGKLKAKFSDKDKK